MLQPMQILYTFNSNSTNSTGFDATDVYISYLAGTESGINNYIYQKYQTNRATGALNKWIKPVVNTDTSFSVNGT